MFVTWRRQGSLPAKAGLLTQPQMTDGQQFAVLDGYMDRAVTGRTGRKFRQDESYDHWIRDESELNRVIRYIENNPVRAGLVDRIEDWPWSSAGQVGNLPHVSTFRHKAPSLRG